MEKNQNVRTKNAFMPFFFHKNFAKIFYKLIPLGHLLFFFFNYIPPWNQCWVTKIIYTIFIMKQLGHRCEILVI